MCKVKGSIAVSSGLQAVGGVESPSRQRPRLAEPRPWCGTGPSAVRSSPAERDS